MYCPSCGAENLNTDMRCLRCGTSLIGETVGGSDTYRNAARAVDMRIFGRIGAFVGFALTFALSRTVFSSLYFSDKETYMAAIVAAVVFGFVGRFIASRRI